MAASPRPPSWAVVHTVFNAGVLGETALPGDWGGPRRWSGRVLGSSPRRGNVWGNGGGSKVPWLWNGESGLWSILHNRGYGLDGIDWKMVGEESD